MKFDEIKNSIVDLSDQEVVDLLDCVSSELKKRNHKAGVPVFDKTTIEEGLNHIVKLFEDKLNIKK